MPPATLISLAYVQISQSGNTTGISGYVLLGSTGERVHLDEREYLEVIEAARAGI